MFIVAYLISLVFVIVYSGISYYLYNYITDFLLIKKVVRDLKVSKFMVLILLFYLIYTLFFTLFVGSTLSGKLWFDYG